MAWALHLIAKGLQDGKTSLVDAVDTDLNDTAGYGAKANGISSGSAVIEEQETEEAMAIPHNIKDAHDTIEVSPVQKILADSYRLGATTRRHREAEQLIEKSLESDQQSRVLNMEFVSNKQGKVYEVAQLRGFVKRYWNQLCTQNNISQLQKEGFLHLKSICDTKWFEDLNGFDIGLRSSPAAHCECILLQDWYNNHKGEKKLPPVGVSSLACGTCTLFIRAMLQYVYGNDQPKLESIVPGSRSDAFWACMLPGTTEVPVMWEVASHLKTRINNHLNDSTIVGEIKRELQDAQNGLPSSAPKHDPEGGSNSAASSSTPAQSKSTIVGTNKPTFGDLGSQSAAQDKYFARYRATKTRSQTRPNPFLSNEGHI